MSNFFVLSTFKDFKILMVLISKSGNKTTTISYFKIDPEYQKRQVDLLRKFIDYTLSRQPGFVSSTIHKSSKGSNIINYSQWADLKGHNVTIKSTPIYCRLFAAK